MEEGREAGEGGLGRGGRRRQAGVRSAQSFDKSPPRLAQDAHPPRGTPHWRMIGTHSLCKLWRPPVLEGPAASSFSSLPILLFKGPRARPARRSAPPPPGRGRRPRPGPRHLLPRHPPPPAVHRAPRPARGRRPPIGHSAPGRRREKMSGVGTRTGARAHAAGKAAGARRAYRGRGVPDAVTPARAPRRGRGFDTPAPARDPRPSLDGQAGSEMRIVGASGGGGEQGRAFGAGGGRRGSEKKSFRWRVVFDEHRWFFVCFFFVNMDANATVRPSAWRGPRGHPPPSGVGTHVFGGRKHVVRLQTGGGC